MKPLIETRDDRKFFEAARITPPESDNPLASESIEHAAAIMSTPGAFVTIGPGGTEVLVVPFARYEAELSRKRAALRTAARYRANLREWRAEARRQRTHAKDARGDLRTVVITVVSILAIFALALWKGKP